MKTQKKDIYRICMEDMGGPCFLVKSEEWAQKLKERLNKEWGPNAKIILKKQPEDSQDATL